MMTNDELEIVLVNMEKASRDLVCKSMLTSGEFLRNVETITDDLMDATRTYTERGVDPELLLYALLVATRSGVASYYETFEGMVFSDTEPNILNAAKSRGDSKPH